MVGLVALGFSLWASANSPNGVHYVKAVAIHDSGNVIVTLDGNSNTEGCATAGAANAVLFSKSNPNFNKFYAMALLAQTLNKPVYGWVNGCTDLWGNGATMIPTGTTLEIES